MRLTMFLGCTKTVCAEPPVIHTINLLSVWNLVKIFPASVQVVARTSNRLFFDLPICKILWPKVLLFLLAIRQRVGIPAVMHRQCRCGFYARSNAVPLAQSSQAVSRPFAFSLLPPKGKYYFLRVLGPFLSPRKRTLRQVLKFLGPLIDERLEQEKRYGRDWSGRPVCDPPYSATMRTDKWLE
jgi:hypothetical protein